MNDTDKTLDQLKAETAAFCSERDWDQFHTPKDLAIGLTIEAAELLEMFRFKSIEETEAILRKPETRKRIEDELGDCFYFILRFSDRFKFDLTSCLQEKMKQNAKKYPVEKSKGRNVKYDEL